MSLETKLKEIKDRAETKSTRSYSENLLEVRGSE